VYTATTQREHRHIRRENFVTARAEIFIEINTTRHGQDFPVSQRHQVNPEILSFTITDIDKIKALAFEPVYYPSFEYVGFLPEYYASSWVSQGKLKALLEDEIYLESEVTIATHKAPQNPLMTSKLLKIARETIC
jgi:hypothetical protein